MAKGMKMGSCRKLNCGNEIFTLKQLSKEDNDKLICRFCSARVMYVSSYQKQSSKKKVSAYLRLWSNEEHHENCKNTLKNAVNHLVAQSQAVENTQPILKKQQDNTTIFRLNLLQEAQISLKTSSKLVHNQKNTENVSARNKYVKTDKVLSSYFYSAVGIAKIRGLIEQDRDDIRKLENTVKIQYKDKLIPWNDFYYDDERYHVLYKRLEKSKVEHPVALKVTVKKQPDYKNASTYPWSIQCFSEQYEKEAKKTIIIPRIKTDILEISQAFAIQQTYILVGEIWLNKVKDKNNIFRNINIVIQGKAQFTIYVG
ncbi:MAG: hypothetical protein QNJ42_17430 [Crocosphaera sp.]|nr:hypothetical protein [Crocosphaera sp.]